MSRSRTENNTVLIGSQLGVYPRLVLNKKKKKTGYKRKIKQIGLSEKAEYLWKQVFFRGLSYTTTRKSLFDLQ